AREPVVSRASAKRAPRTRTTTAPATVFRPRFKVSVIPTGSAPESAVATKRRLSWAFASDAESGRGSPDAMAAPGSSRSTAHTKLLARGAASGWTQFSGFIGPLQVGLPGLSAATGRSVSSLTQSGGRPVDARK